MSRSESEYAALQEDMEAGNWEAVGPPIVTSWQINRELIAAIREAHDAIPVKGEDDRAKVVRQIKMTLAAFKIEHRAEVAESIVRDIDWYLKHGEVS